MDKITVDAAAVTTAASRKVNSSLFLPNASVSLYLSWSASMAIFFRPSALLSHVSQLKDSNAETLMLLRKNTNLSDWIY